MQNVPKGGKIRKVLSVCGLLKLPREVKFNNLFPVSVKSKGFFFVILTVKSCQLQKLLWP